MKSKLWLVVRIVIVVFWICGGLAGAWPPAEMPVLWLVLLAAVCLFWPLISGRYLVLGIYRKLPADSAWLLPCWHESPFHSEQPFQFFHLSGYSFLLFGLASFLREGLQAQAFPLVLPSEIFVGLFGLGMLIGMHWAIASQRERFVAQSSAEPGGWERRPGAGEIRTP